MTTKRKPREKKPKQGFLDGLEPPTIREVEKAADDYCEARDARMEGTQEEIKMKARLQGLMEKHGLKRYEYDGKVIELVPGEETVKVKKAEKVKAEGNGASNGEE